jgi:general secretion pathway protein E
VSRDFLATPGVLKLLVYQALLPLLCQHCALQAPEGNAGEQAAWQHAGQRIASLYDADISGLRLRNPRGCTTCSAHHLPELKGFAGRTVVAEMIEPGVDDEFLLCVRRGDNIEQRRRLSRQRRAAYDDPDMSGKTAMDCAVYKALHGLVDPRDIEARFRSFDTVALERQWQD